MNEDAEALERAREVSQETAVQLLRLLFEFKQRADGARAGAADGSPAAGKDSAANVLFDVARLSLRTYEQWLKLGSHHFDFIADTLLGPKPGGHAQPGQITIKASVPLGEERPARFFLKNPDPVQARVCFTAPILRSASGQNLRAEVTWRRADLVSIPEAKDDLLLGPCQEGRFEAVIRVPRDAEPGRYCGPAVVVVGNRVAGQLLLEVEALTPWPTSAVEASGAPGERPLSTPFTLKNTLPGTALASISTPIALPSKTDEALVADVKLVPLGAPSTSALVGAGQAETFQVELVIPPAATRGIYQGVGCVLLSAQPAMHLTLRLEVK